MPSPTPGSAGDHLPALPAVTDVAPAVRAAEGRAVGGKGAWNSVLSTQFAITLKLL